MVRFFLPLAATSMLMMGSHSLANSAIVKTRDPTLALASFSVAQSLGMLLEGVVTVARQLGLAQVKNVQTWRVLGRLMRLTVLGLTIMMIVIGFTPLGKMIFYDILGAPLDVAEGATVAFRVFIIFPAISCLRMMYHSIIILNKRTIFTTIAMAARVSVMVSLATMFILRPVEIGGAVGSIVLISGIATEAIVSFLAGRRFVGSLDSLYSGEIFPALTLSQAARFYWPLAVSGLVSNLSRMSISAGLSRASDPKIALAAYQVGWTIAWLFISPVASMHQVTTVFAKGRKSVLAVKRFGLTLGCLCALMLFAFVLSGAGNVVLSRWIGAGPELVPPALRAIGLMGFLPFITCWSEMFTGSLLITGNSAAIGAGRVIYVLVTTAAIFLGASMAPGLGASLAPVGMVAGSLAEACYLGRCAGRTADDRFSALLPTLARNRTGAATGN
jgi:hypothetical protein